ncbi:MAG: SH3 domain-containing protein [Heyndrickxia sp.]
MGRKLTFILLILLLTCTGFNQPVKQVQAETSKVTVNVSVLNIRKGPGLSYPILKQVQKGDQFTVFQKKSDWYEIKMPSGDTGWAASWLVTLNESNKTLGNGNGTVKVNGLRLRSGPSSDSSILRVLQKDQVVTIQSQNGNWVKVMVNGMNGWISKDFLSTEEKVSTQPSNSKGMVTVDHLNIRTSPTISSSVIGSLNTGNEITILEEQNGWVHFTFGKLDGWVSSQYVQKVKGNEEKQPPSTNNSNQKMTGTVNVKSLNVRSKPSLDGKIIGSITSGQRFEIEKEENNWIEIKVNNQNGWIAGWYVNKSNQSTVTTPQDGNQKGSVKILYNGTNLRSNATTNSSILSRANAGDSFKILDSVNDWYKIQLKSGSIAYVASWLVSSSETNTKASKNNTPSSTTAGGLKGKVIIIDPGHGGQDKGTSGYRGTFEKNLTLSTALTLYQKLKNAGANVILTRSDDHYISLPSRVGVAESNHADAFISIHFDSLKADQSVTGHTTYYYHENQKELALDINTGISQQVAIKDRGVRFGDFHVIRENNAPAVLTELGYLSNPNEELLINTQQYQELVTTGIYNGLVEFFK